MDSIWHQTTVSPRFSPAPLPDRADTVIIGGGMAGILTSYLLKEAGVSSIILEAARIGSGQTGRTTAKITSQHGLCYDRLIRTLGAGAARLYARANEEALAEYRRVIWKNRIECNFQELPACLYAGRRVQAVRQEAEAAARLGLPVRFSEHAQLPFPVKAALYFDRQAQFHPLEFLYAIAETLQIYENTPVLGVSGHTVRTAAGDIQAKHIVFACHYPFVRPAGLYFMRIHQERSYVLAVRNAFQPDCMYYGADSGAPSLRSREDLLLIGGCGHRTGESPLQDCYRSLYRNGLEHGLFSKETVSPGHVIRWSAQDCMTLDGLPYIGRFSRLHPGWYVATGFGKWGMTGSMVSAQLLRNLLTGQESPYASLFSPQRFPLQAVLPSLKKESGHAVRSLAVRISPAPVLCREPADTFRSLLKSRPLSPDRPTLQEHKALPELSPGEGRIVTYRGRKTGVSMDQEKRLHFVSPYCPHMGCQLTWNAVEQTWDCPCHGSRFTREGDLLDGPALRGLKQPFPSVPLPGSARSRSGPGQPLSDPHPALHNRRKE